MLTEDLSPRVPWPRASRMCVVVFPLSCWGEGRDDFMGGVEVKLLPGVNLKPGKIFEQWWE